MGHFDFQKFTSGWIERLSSAIIRVESLKTDPLMMQALRVKDANSQSLFFQNVKILNFHTHTSVWKGRKYNQCLFYLSLYMPNYARKSHQIGKIKLNAFSVNVQPLSWREKRYSSWQKNSYATFRSILMKLLFQSYSGSQIFLYKNYMRSLLNKKWILERFLFLMFVMFVPKFYFPWGKNPGMIQWWVMFWAHRSTGTLHHGKILKPKFQWKWVRFSPTHVGFNS